jgi:hypothetical protein
VKTRTRAAIAAVALLLGLAHPATADPPNDTKIRNNCSFNTLQQQTLTPDTWTGAVYGYAAAYSPTPAHNPVTVVRSRCDVLVDGVAVVSVEMRTAGPLAVLAPTPIQYTARDDQRVELCVFTDTVDAHGQVRTDSCYDHYGWEQFPPQDVIDLLDLVLAAVDAAYAPVDAAEVEYVDPLVCPVLASLAPGVPGTVDITAEGDTTLVGAGPFWDCPPYGNLFLP